jgi:hypothetical protein
MGAQIGNHPAATAKGFRSHVISRAFAAAALVSPAYHRAPPGTKNFLVFTFVYVPPNSTTVVSSTQAP